MCSIIPPIIQVRASVRWQGRQGGGRHQGGASTTLMLETPHGVNRERPRVVLEAMDGDRQACAGVGGDADVDVDMDANEDYH